MTTATTTSTKAAKKKDPKPKRITMELEVELTDAEKLARSEELLNALQAKDELVSAKSMQTANINAEIKLAQKLVAELTKVGRSGKEKRDIECVEEFDYRLQQVRVRRNDTKEVVQTRAMSLEERQIALPMPGIDVDVPASPAPKKGEPLSATLGERLKAKGAERWDSPDGPSTPKGVSLRAKKGETPCPSVVDGQECIRKLKHNGAHVFAPKGATGPAGSTDIDAGAMGSVIAHAKTAKASSKKKGRRA